MILDEFRDTSTIVRHKLSVDLFASTVDALVEAKSQLEGVETEAVLLVREGARSPALLQSGKMNDTGPGFASVIPRSDLLPSLQWSVWILWYVVALDALTLL